MSDYLDKEHLFFCKNRAGYIFPANVKTKLLPPTEEMDDQLFFITTFKAEPVTKHYIYFMIDTSDVGRP